MKKEKRKNDVREFSGTNVLRVITDHGYFPVIMQVGPKSAVMVIRSGAGHMGVTGRLELMRTNNSGATWTGPVVVADSDWDDRNPGMGSAGDTLIIAYHRNGCYLPDGSYQDGLRSHETWIARSTDQGITWDDRFLMSHMPLNGYSPYGPIVTSDDGTLLMTLYARKVPSDRDSGLASYIVRSTDQGKTWGDPSLMSEAAGEAALLLLPDGTLLSAQRHRHADGNPVEGDQVCISRSDDMGYTWSDPVAVTGYKEHPGSLLRLSNGWLVLTFGHRHPPQGVQAIVSKDEGFTWSEDRLLYDDKQADHDCGYPSSVLLDDGTIITAYYSSGPQTPADDGTNAFCNVVVYREEELLDALRNIS